MELPKVEVKSNNLYQAPNLSRQKTEIKTNNKVSAINYNFS